MNSEQIAEFNRKCAEYMDWPFLDYDPESGAIYCGDLHSYTKYDPYHDANSRNKVLEKMRAITEPFGKMWQTTVVEKDVARGANSMEAAQIACIQAVLNNE